MRVRNVLVMYGDLIKAKQTILLLFTAFFSYLITAWPDMFNWIEFLVLLLSLFLAISGSTVLNMYIDRNIDAMMERTKDRPLPSGKVSITTVLINGFVLSALGILIAYNFLGWLTTLIIFLGLFFDVVIYSILLKKRTRFSIIFGGIAGGLPAMSARVAILHEVDIVGVLFLIFILAWIPVHILTLAMTPTALEGYKNAKIPMWPVVRSKTETMRVIAIGAFISALVLFSIAIILAVNIIVLILIGICCAFLIFIVIKDLMKPTEELTFKIFKFASIFMVLGFLLLFLGVLFK